MATPEASRAAGAAADAAVRGEALDAARSFIVQAPAGSGKTELLIQRLLVLLAAVEQPEQVLAITFTRKAAAEMRARLLETLAAAAEEQAPAPHTPHEVAARERARAVVAQDRAQGWGLLETPARLRIQTIDSLCAALTRERPVLSGLGEAPAIAEEADALYQTAARATLAALEGDGPEAAAVERLLLHLEDDHARAEGLLASMLARRDQWLRHAQPWDDPAAVRGALETELRAAVDEALADLHDTLTAGATKAGLALEVELAALAPYAAQHLGAEKPDAPVARLGGLTGLPAPQADALPLWQGVAELLTTGTGAWRRTLTKAQGFPIDKAAGDPATLKETKARALGLLDALQARPELAGRLRGACALPPPVYADAQWEVLAALLELLPRAVERLRTVFAEAGEMDYAEVALGAIRALEGGSGRGNGGGSDAAPLRDEARHILVDEFQDTSHGQFRLLERLTAHWKPDDGRTLFLVGDPMQSIYRFREAEVGLFLRARRTGIGALCLHPLRLEVNFRSTGALVGWVNDVFPGVLAPVEALATGAVPFAAATPHQLGDDGPGVTVHALPQPAGMSRDAIEADEARQIAEVIAETRRERPEETVSILVRTRGHLRAILPALQQAGLPFQAVEIEALAERPEVQDLLMLLRALTHLGDRVAWLAVLRAPWCGLLLADLLCLAEPAPYATLWERLRDAEAVAGLSTDGQARVTRLVAALEPCLAARERRPLRRWLEGAWLALGGPACVPEVAWPNVEACLARLEALPAATPPGGPEQSETLLERLYAAPDPQADARLQVMSIHKAKGLQFDTVILPGLGRAPRSDETPLLRWFERAQPAKGGAGLLLAPIHAAGPERDPVFDYLAELEKEKAHHETGRLLYVAATRAKRALHLFGHALLDEDGPKEPDKRSLLARLWPAVRDTFEAAAAPDDNPAAASARATPTAQPPPPGAPPGLRRLAAGWQAPPAPPPVAARQAAEAAADVGPGDAYEIEFRWAGETARHVGTVVHRLLRLIARYGSERWQTGGGAFTARAIAAALGALGVPAAEHATATERVQDALRRTLADERGRWVLAPHTEGHSEYALTGVVDGRPARFVIDRTFVDEAGVRWIVDFKTGTHEGGDLEAFLAREQERYRSQLEGYAALMNALEPGRTVRLALYFPLLQAWREWPAPEPQDAGQTR